MELLETLSSIVMLLCSILGIVCALLFIGVVALHRQCHTMTIMLVLNTTVAGAIVNITCGCQAIYQLIGDGNDPLCAFRGFLLHGLAALLCQGLCIQAVHRLFVIVFATRRYLQSTRIIVPMVVLQWLVSSTFALPTLIGGRIIYHPGSQICQISLNNWGEFLYFALIIYCGPLSIIIPVYIKIVHYMKQNSFSKNIVRSMAQRFRQRREFRLIRRILSLVVLLLFMGIPYLTFFFLAQISSVPPVPYAQRVSFVSVSFGYGIFMLLNLITTDDVKKYLINRTRRVQPDVGTEQVQHVTTINLPVRTTMTAGTR